jgi:hypothetical protein
MVSNATFNTFSYIVSLSFIGGGNRGTRRKLPTRRKSLMNFLNSETKDNNRTTQKTKKMSNTDTTKKLGVN